MSISTSPAISRARRLPVPRVRSRPVLLFLVYGVFLVIVGVTATAQVVMASLYVSTATLNHTVGTDAQVVRGFVTEQLRPADLEPGALPPDHGQQLATALRSFITNRGIVRAEVRRLDGTVVVSDAPVAGFVGPVSADWQRAAGGDIAVSLVPAVSSDAAPGPLGTDQVIQELFPLILDGRPVAVIGIWRDATPIVTALADVRRDVVIVTVSAAIAAAFVLYLVFRSAQGRITRQTAALLDATRRDPLTGVLNHGALVEDLGAAIERRRSEGGEVAVALVDIDNFRNLNDTWGHGAGDEAIFTVVDALHARVPDGAVVGRYGPDEFLVVLELPTAGVLLDAIETVRRDLAGVRLRFAESEDLPLTISAAIARYPDDGTAVTELMANAALTLRDAKSSGGDAVRVAGLETTAGSVTRTFDVFQGLILAVDAKDRYTKRHSEDVARYALFIADRVGMPAEERRTLRLAGLLHDVGKVGIPDHVLRKPGKLTDAEYAIVKQHVVLGDAILRDLPDLDAIRAGVRHHHERWDGRGYMHGLHGEDIPYLARILAVADAFSAMTTSRSYRKALELEEALRRLEDAAGTQLDERLVAAFVAGMETDPAAPIPGADLAPVLWIPDEPPVGRVA